MQEYQVTGMSCAACSARVEKAVTSVSGVSSCSVSLLTNSMTVEGAASSEQIMEAVKKAGYGAFPKGSEKKKVKEEEKKKDNALSKLIFSALLLLALMYVSMGHMVSLPLPSFFTPSVQGTYQFILSLWILILHRRYFINGFQSLFRGGANMDTLVALGSGVSFLYSTILLIAICLFPEKCAHLVHSLYFESAAMILVLISVGKKLEEYSKGKTTSAIRALEKLSPETALVLVDGKEVEKRVEEIAAGDLVAVRPGENFPVDGMVFQGEGAVDESALTGESLPVDKKEGDPVFTGTANLSGYLVCRAERVGGETTLARMIERVTASGASKAPIARLADRVSGVFVPVILCLALITFIIWCFLGSVGKALEYGISVLVVSCPCALGLATPVAIMVGSGVAARHGVLFKTAEGLEKAGKTKFVILDKTGTVTKGKMSVTDLFTPENVSPEELLSLAVSLEEKSAHPLAQAILSYGKEKGIAPLPLSEFASKTGFGVEGALNGKRVLGGKKEMLTTPLSKNAITWEKARAAEGKTLVFFEKGGLFQGILAIADEIKEDSPEAISRLHKMGIQTVMITGDRKETAEAIAQKAGIGKVYAGILPEGKEDLVQSFKKEGFVMMVGDGINDAPALAAAHIGVAIGSGMDVARDAAEVVLMNSSLSSLPFLIGLSRKTLKNIKENLFWAFCYNFVGIPLAAGVFVPLTGWSLTPMFGAAAMSLSSFLVVSNALRLNLYGEKKKKKEKKKEIDAMEKIVKIEGMMCPHCEAHVKKALEALDGVKEAIPSHEKNEAKIILSSDVSDAIIRETIEKEGYKVL